MSGNQRPPMGPPDTPNRYLQQSPSLFPTLQLSPDIYAHQFPPGPATAPAYPNQRLFWDPSSVDFQNLSFSQPYHDPYQFSPVATSTPFVPSSTVIPSFVPSHSRPEEQPYDLPTLPRSTSYSHIDSSAFPAPFKTSPRMPAPQMENPSMFLSSPARRFGTGDHLTDRFAGNPISDRPAYAHQIEESRREEENKRMRRGDLRKPSITRSVMEALRRPVSPMKDSRPGLKRSVTHSGVRNERGLRLQTQGSRGGRNSPVSSEQRKQRLGRSSPLKSPADLISQTINTSQSTKRGSLSLAIDENGVAKTVMTKAAEDMDLDDESESEPESFDEDDLYILHSQSNSFAYDGIEDIGQTQSAGLYGHSKTNSHSTIASVVSAKQSYQSSMSSLPNTRGSDGQQGRRKRPVLGSNIPDDTLMEEEPMGNAQQALRAIIQDRSRSTSSQGDHTSNQLHSSPPLQQSQYALYNASPTTITDPDLATPSTDRDSVGSTLSVHCLCKSTALDGSGPMIQCDACSKWSHSTCVGIDHRRRPESYICVYCTQTPIRPGQPSLRPSALPTTASPLAHKSKRPR